MLINSSRPSDRSRFADHVGRLESIATRNKPQQKTFTTINQNTNTNHNTSTANSIHSSKNGFHIYENSNNSSVFTKSNVSTQDTLTSSAVSNSNSTLASSLSSSFVSSSPETPLEKIEDIESNVVDYMHNPKRNTITSTIKLGKHFNNVTSTKYSIHSCRKTSITNVSKNNIVLINNVPYPVQLQFPAKISKRKSKDLLTNLRNFENKENIESSHIYSNQIKRNSNSSYTVGCNSSNTFIESPYHQSVTPDLDSPESVQTEILSGPSETYDLLLQLIQSYID